LEIWKKSIDLAIEIYNLTQKGSLNNEFSLKDQIRRSATSVSNNIAEGFEYGNNNQLVRFLRIAIGSLGEVRSQIVVLQRLNFITSDEYQKIYNDCKLFQNRFLV